MNSVTIDEKIYHNNVKKNTNRTHDLVIECIEISFFELLKTKRYEDISITEIIKKAGVSRMGFYRNYASKEEIIENLVFRCFYSAVQDIKKTRRLNFSTSQIIETSLEKLKDHAEQMKLLLENNLMALLFNCYEKAFFSLYETKKSSAIRDYSAMMFIGELFTLEMTWIKNGLKESPKQMSKIYQRLLKLKCE